MRLVSATGILALALIGAGCRSYATRGLGGDDLVAKLKALGIEGKSYSIDLGQVASIHLGRVFPMDDDFLIEDVHGHLTYLEGATLTPRWDFYGLPKPFDGEPDHTPSAIIGMSGGKLFVITRANGVTVADPVRVDVIPSAGLVATDATAYIPTFPTPSGNKTVYAVNVVTGYQGWGWRSESDIVAKLGKGGPLPGDTFYFATSDGSMYAFPTYSATERSPEPAWTRHLQARVEKDLVVEGDDLAVVTEDGRLVCMDRITGNTRWEAYPNAGERAAAKAQFSSRHVYYRCGGELRAYARDTGLKAWSVKDATGFVADRGGRTLLSGKGGLLIAVDTKTGEVLGRTVASAWTFVPRVAPNATIYAVSQWGEVLAVETGW